MVRAYDAIIERDAEGHYVARVPELRGCHTQAKSLDVLIRRVREAIAVCLEVDGDDVSPHEVIGVQCVWMGT